MHKNTRRQWLAAAALLLVGESYAVPIYEGNDVTLEMTGYFTAHMVNSYGETIMQDGASRIAFKLDVPVYGDWDTGFHLEWGVAAISSAQDLIVQGDQQVSPDNRDLSLYLRQGNAHAEHEKWGRFSAGKQWGAYYEVTYITDWFNVSGGLASGTYSYGTDGGSTGSGRADSALAWRKTWVFDDSEFKIALQRAAHVADLNISIRDAFGPNTLFVCPPRDCEFGQSHGIAMVYRANVGKGIMLGASYNRVKLDINSNNGEVFEFIDGEEVLIARNVPISASTNTWASAIGAYYGGAPFTKGWYVAGVVQRSQNNELAPVGSVTGITNFFDAKGSESFFSYTWGANDCYSVYGGHNYLVSDDPEFDAALVEDSRFKLAQYYYGFQYQWNKRVRLYFENAADASNRVARPVVNDFIAVGFRIDI
uniref:porin n=1 Tax=Microbulbifer agarilyticus TaxID=260552 RepID=UPI000255BAAE|nr:porin [Microbulbifer agarilyticus]